MSTRSSLGCSPKEGSRHPVLAWETSFLGGVGGQDCCLGSKEPGEASGFTLTESHNVNKLPEASYLRWGLQTPGSWEGTTHQGNSPSGEVAAQGVVLIVDFLAQRWGTEVAPVGSSHQSVH